MRGPNDIPTFSDFDNDGLDDHLEFEEGTDPVLADSDGDELSDGEEVNTTLSSPLNADSDSDLLTDGEEVNLYGSDPNRFDSDDDLVSDFLEVSSGTDPLLSSERPLSTFTPRDQLNVEGGGLGTLLIDSGSIVGLIGQEIDDTLEGTIEYSFDLEFVSLANDSGDGGFTLLEVYNDGEEGFGVGNNFFDTTWTVFGAPGVGAVELLDTDGNTVPVETSAPESFTVRMDMLAGGDDTLTVTFRGQEAIFVGPISFDEVRMRSGFGGQSANLTNMSFTFTPLSSVEETGDLTLEILSVDVVDNMAELSVANVPGAGAQTFHIRSSTNLRQWIPISGSDFTSSGPLSVAPVNGIERQFFQVWEGPASN